MASYNFWKIEGEQDHLILTLDLGTESKQNVLKQEVLEELEEIILRKIKPKTLVIASAKPNSFCAGADINQIKKLLDKPEELKTFLIRLHRLLLKIHNAPFPIVAAISGECLGGGLELALACHARVATNHPRTRFGLPEVGIGLIPGFGGTQLLPKVVGLPKALEIIAGQKKLDANDAQKTGLISEIAEPEQLIAKAQEIAKTLKAGKNAAPQRKKLLIEKLPILGRKLILYSARKRILKETKGVYPAPLLAIRAVAESNQPLEQGLEKEGELFAKAAATFEAKNLIDIFFLRNEARSRRWVNCDPQPAPKRVGVIGAGVMGRSIAYALISSDIPVVLHDSFSQAVHDAVIFIEQTLVKGVKLGKLTKQQAEQRRNLLTASWGESLRAFAETDFVIEAIIENLEIKLKTLRELEKVVRPEAVIATNTSSILPSEIGQALEKRGRFSAMHFFNPAHVMELVEISGTAETEPQTLAKTVALAKAMGKTPVVLKKECAGLLVNRVMVQYLMQSLVISMAPNGPTPWLLDTLFEREGMVMGPFKTLDLIGLDTGAHVMRMMKNYYSELPDLSGIDFLQYKDLFGQKTGKGFYIWKNGKPAAPNKEISQRLGMQFTPNSYIPVLGLVGMSFVIAEMKQEAERIYSEGISNSKEMIDLALILGGGILPNRRGLLNE